LISEYSALLGEPLTPNTQLDLIDQMLELSELSLVSVESDLSSELSVLESSIRSVRAAIEQISSIGAASDIERLREQQITADIASVAWSTNGGYCSRTRLKIFDPCCPIPSAFYRESGEILRGGKRCGQIRAGSHYGCRFGAPAGACEDQRLFALNWGA